MTQPYEVDPEMTAVSRSMNDARRRKRQTSGDFPSHPLFPVEEGEPRPNVGYIQVCRLQGGAREWCQQSFLASDLTELSQLAEQFGKGTYELIARTDERGKMGPISTRTTYRIDGGKPKPLNVFAASDDDEPPAPEPPKPVGPVPTDPMGLMVFMMQAQAQSADRMMAMQQQAADRQMQMFIGMMTSMQAASAEASKANASVMAAALSRQGTEAAGLVSATGALAQTFAQGMVRAPTSEADSVVKVLELMKKMKAANIGDDSIGEILGGVGQILPGFAALQQAAVEKERLDFERARAAKAAQEQPPRQTNTVEAGGVVG